MTIDMRVRLIKKLADCVDGVDLRGREAGDTLDVATSEARLLIAEGWAVREGPRGYVSSAAHGREAQVTAADGRRRRHG